VHPPSCRHLRRSHASGSTPWFALLLEPCSGCSNAVVDRSPFELGREGQREDERLGHDVVSTGPNSEVVRDGMEHDPSAAKLVDDAERIRNPCARESIELEDASSMGSPHLSAL
jgi:hypothetical protein